MRVTPELREQIIEAVRMHVNGASPLIEVGMRDGVRQSWGPNALLWTDEGDLGTLELLKNVHEFNDDLAHPGCVELDLYVTTGRGSDRALETNVSVLIRDGAVIGATSDAREVAALRASLDFPETAGW